MYRFLGSGPCGSMCRKSRAGGSERILREARLGGDGGRVMVGWLGNVGWLGTEGWLVSVGVESGVSQPD